MSTFASLALVVSLRRGTIENVWATGPAQVATFDLDTEGASDGRRIPALHEEPGRWTPWNTAETAARAQAILAAMPADDAPDAIAGALTAQRVVLQVQQGMVVDALADGNVRILVLDQDVRDPDDAMTFPGEQFHRGETFEAVPEWLSPAVDPLRLSLALRDAEQPTPPEAARRRRRNP